MLTVVLDLRNPGGNATRSSSATLEANHTFSYDLQIFDRRDPTTPINLRALGLLENPVPLGYERDELPAFRTCPQELDRLVIVHGSCRQLFSVPPVEDDPAADDDPFVPPPDWPRERPTEFPEHDGKPYPFPPDEYPLLPKRDGMLWVDTLIEARGPVPMVEPMVERPHQLFLTGDEIYADQTPPALLPALNNLARVLVGDEELGADPTGTRYGSVVLLSGDVHIGWSAALDYWSAPDGEPIRTARIVQFVSSGLTKDWGAYAPALRGHALTLDVFESAMNPALMHAERVGWGTPLRTVLTPPPQLGTLVTQAERAHHFYRARLKMRAPVVPRHGWPEGTKEVREPNWAWRAVMGRDDRVESTLRPTMDRRWTPVDLPPDPIDPSAIGWYARAARRIPTSAS